MTFTRILQLSSLTLLLESSLIAAACPSINLENNYIKTAISCDGTLGFGGNNYPGIQYDSTGQGVFQNNDDIIIPGAPHEIFSVKYGSTIETNSNSNYNSPDMQTFISGNSNLVMSSSNMNDKLRIKHVYTLLEDSKLLEISVSIKNISAQAIDQVKYLRSVDPDFNLNIYDTVNQRGNLQYSPEDLVQAQLSNDSSIALFTTDQNFIHNTSVSDWTEDPDVSLSGIDIGDGDNSIDIAFNLEDFAIDEEKTFTYGYLLTTDVEEVTEAIEDAQEIVNEQGYTLIYTTYDNNDTEIPFNIVKSANVPLSDYTLPADIALQQRLLVDGLDLEIQSNVGFNFQVTYTIPDDSTLLFTGYSIHNPNTGSWSDIGTIFAFPTTVGYDISNDSKTLVLTLKDGADGDIDAVADGTIIHVGFPEVIDTKLIAAKIEPVQQTITTATYSETKSLPLSNTAIALMFFLFTLVAYIGLKKGDELENAS